MKRFAAVLRGLAVVSLLWASRGAVAADPPPPPGADLYAQNCAACHDHPKDRIPPKATAQPAHAGRDRHGPHHRHHARAGGRPESQRPHCAGDLPHRPRAVRQPCGAAGEELCAPSRAARFELPASPVGQWNGWGVDLDNSRFQPKPGLDAKDLPKLKLKWAFGYHGSSVYGQPTVVGGRVYVTSLTGRVYSLDAATGCTYWTYDAEGPSRTAVSLLNSTVFFGDDTATIYALNAADGKLLWKQRLDQHPSAQDQRCASALRRQALRARLFARGTGRGDSWLSVLHVPGQRGRSSGERWKGALADLHHRQEGRALAQGRRTERSFMARRVWPCGRRRRSIRSARRCMWERATPTRTRPRPTRTPSWPCRWRRGAFCWANQVRAQDNYIVGCDVAPAGPCEVGKACPKGPPNCPAPVGPDVDLGVSPILRTLPDGRQVLMTGQKSGEIHALDPQTGKEVWTAQVGVGSALGGIEWGPAADGSTTVCRRIGCRDQRRRGARRPHCLTDR